MIKALAQSKNIANGNNGINGMTFCQIVTPRSLSGGVFNAALSDIRAKSMSSTPTSENLKVFIRIRPPLPRELSPGLKYNPVHSVTPDKKTITLIEEPKIDALDKKKEIQPIYHKFTFDQIFDQNSSQQQVYEYAARSAALSALDGYNATILAYGQTGTGKTYTMEGFEYGSTHCDRGIIPRAMEEIFKGVESRQKAGIEFVLRASYLQIYNEIIYDLLKNERTNLQIREDKKRGLFVEGLSDWLIKTPNDISKLISRGALLRTTGSTNLNDFSSRSHAVVIIVVEQSTCDKENFKSQTKIGKLNLVDLAGSERVCNSGATGKRLEESKKINQSLSALGNVISALTDHKIKSHIPYRDSKLTRILEDSLGGNCKTTMIATISPMQSSFNESLSSLKFANRAKAIKNYAHVNEECKSTLIKKCEAELVNLKEIARKSQISASSEKILGTAFQGKRLSEANCKTSFDLKSSISDKDNFSGFNTLRSKDIEDTPEFINALKEKQSTIRKEYSTKLQELERENRDLEKGKQEIDKYKQQLVKQKDIMLDLLSKLSDRDKTILMLQAELLSIVGKID